MREPKHATVIAYVAARHRLDGHRLGRDGGGDFILGKSNKATTTSLENTGGVALSLKSKSGSAPLAVSSSTKVSRLNADQLDGLNSTALQNQAQHSWVPAASSVQNGTPMSWDVPTLPSGPYLAWLSATVNFSLKPSTVTSTATCDLKNGDDVVVGTISGETTRTGTARMSGNWAVTNPGDLTLSCTGSDDGAPDPMHFWTPQHVSLTLLKVDKTLSTALTPLS